MWMFVLRWQLNILKKEKNDKARNCVHEEEMLMTFQTLTLLYSANLTHGKKRENMLFFIESWRRRTDWMINILARVALYQEKFVSIYFTFSLFFISFFLYDERNIFAVHWNLNFHHRRHRHTHPSVSKVPPPSQSALTYVMAYVWFLWNYEKNVICLEKHSRFIQSLRIHRRNDFFY